MEMQDSSRKLATEFNPLALKYVADTMPANALLIAFSANFEIRSETAEEKTALVETLFNATVQRMKKLIDSSGYSSAASAELPLMLQMLESDKVKEFLPEKAGLAMADLAVQAVTQLGKYKEDSYNYSRGEDPKPKNLTEIAKLALDYGRKFSAFSPRKPDVALSVKHLAA